MRLVSAIALLAAAVLLVGCGGGGNKPKLVSVTGKVTHQGKAVTGGSVWFHAEGKGSDTEKMSGQLQEDGSFTAKTFPHGEGMPPGKYKVTLSPDVASRVGVPKLGQVPTTPWSLDVPDAGVKDHVFEVK